MAGRPAHGHEHTDVLVTAARKNTARCRQQCGRQGLMPPREGGQGRPFRQLTLELGQEPQHAV